MTLIVKVTSMPAKEFPAHLDGMNKAMRDWTDQAARGECGWTCSDCCCSDSKGMPDACWWGNQRCTEIIQRDKLRAMRAGNEPS
uniref:hypothetical protein n=1 Tax=Pseudomonas laurentiana TaxID=2364649 RepID=UPI0029C67EB5|nr:hypothetical protein [Pseudomonas laurentiana]